MKAGKSALTLKRLGIDTYKEPVVYIHANSPICRAEGFQSQARISVTYEGRSLIATLNKVRDDILALNEISLSDYGWTLLNAKEGGMALLTHPKPVSSLAHIRSKIYGETLSDAQIKEIISDVVAYRYSDIEIASFVTACAGDHLNQHEISDMTRAMMETGDRITWPSDIVVDKHCVGGLPGNRTTPIVVAIVSEFGLMMPKTSSRAITSPAGTADTMEVLAPVELCAADIRRVVEQEGGCIVWGGSACLSPADDILIRVERALEVDSEGQLVASILSKKMAAGSNHVVIDMPVGPTAKVRSMEAAEKLSALLRQTGKELGITVAIHVSDGTQPVGRGIGPALEARDIVSVLKADPIAPLDLREKSLCLAGQIIEFSPDVSKGTGYKIATDILDSGRAWKKFQAICTAQGGLRTIPKAEYLHPVLAAKSGKIICMDNRRLARIAKLAGAPAAAAAGIDLHVRIGDAIEKGQPLFTIHAVTKGEQDYALDYLTNQHGVIQIEDIP